MVNLHSTSLIQTPLMARGTFFRGYERLSIVDNIVLIAKNTHIGGFSGCNSGDFSPDKGERGLDENCVVECVDQFLLDPVIKFKVYIPLKNPRNRPLAPPTFY